jgi:hypothetical protein
LDAPQPMEHPLDEQTPVESTNDLDPIDEFHRDDPIIDPAYIEYHDGIIYRREHDQTEEQINSDLQQATIGATCMVCHRCHPHVHIQYFVAPSDGTMIYYYILYTCQTPVECSLAQEQTQDDDEDFDPQRFFSMCVIQDDTPLKEKGFEVVDIEGNTHNIHEPEEPHIIHYLDDSIEVNNTGTILDFNEEESSHILEEY